MSKPELIPRFPLGSKREVATSEKLFILSYSRHSSRGYMLEMPNSLWAEVEYSNFQIQLEVYAAGVDDSHCKSEHCCLDQQTVQEHISQTPTDLCFSSAHEVNKKLWFSSKPEKHTWMLTIFIDYWGENYEAKCGRERGKKTEKKARFSTEHFYFWSETQ